MKTRTGQRIDSLFVGIVGFVAGLAVGLSMGFYLTALYASEVVREGLK